MRFLGLTITREGARHAAAMPSEVYETVQRLVIDLRSVQEELSQLQGHHLKLRKQFDGSKGGRPVGSVSEREIDAIPVGDKAALRQYAGLRPGQPIRGAR